MSERAAPGAFELLQIGALCGVAIGVGTGLGLLLDHVFGTSPLLVFLGLAVGIVGAAIGSISLIRPYVRGSPAGESHPKE